MVQDVMSTGVVTAKRTDTVRSVVFKMTMRRCGAIPIVENDQTLVGVVTLLDVPPRPSLRRIPEVAAEAALAAAHASP